MRELFHKFVIDRVLKGMEKDRLHIDEENSDFEIETKILCLL